ncbi:MAG TPA: hypothetical protein VIY27_02450, partial [Myxococcota bacterium]
MQRPSGDPPSQDSQISIRAMLRRASLSGLLPAAVLFVVAMAFASVEPFGPSVPVEPAVEAEPAELALPPVAAALPPVEIPEPETE